MRIAILRLATVILFLGVGLVGTACQAADAPADQTALDRYIAKPEPAYHWKLAGHYPGHGQTTYVIALTSQTWRSADEVDKPVWTHWLTVTRPDKARAGTAFLFIGGGEFKDPPPTAPSARAAALAAGTNTVVAEISLVPNQPLAFADSRKHGREEDDLVAYSRVKYIITKDEEWLVRLAMVKSAVKAMDCTQEFLAGTEAGPLKIDHFVVAGGSKRGWTTWLVGTVDPRVVAIIPLVIDALNSERITRHHFEAYGFFSPALKDYVHHGIFPYLVGTPEYHQVLAIENPYSYRHRERLKLPKFLINAAGDQFFLPDGSQFYFADMPPEKHLRYVPNAKHNLKGSDALESLQAFYQAVLDGHPRPKYAWKKHPDGSLEVTVEETPREVNLWQATNPATRDFRLDVIGKTWTPTRLTPEKPGFYIGHVPTPSRGYTAFFVELVYDSGGKYPFKFTSEVSVVPDVLPYKWKDAKAKLGPELSDNAQQVSLPNEVDALKAENARLRSRIAILETADRPAKSERPADSADVEKKIGASRPSSNPVIRQWHLEDAVFEVKVLKVSSTPLAAHVAIHVTNRSSASIVFWQVSVSLYDRAGKYLGKGDTCRTSLRQNSCSDEEILLIGVDASAVSRWVLQLDDIKLESDSGERLVSAERYFRLKEVKGP